MKCPKCESEVDNIDDDGCYRGSDVYCVDCGNDIHICGFRNKAERYRQAWEEMMAIRDDYVMPVRFMDAVDEIAEKYGIKEGDQ